MTSNQDPGLGIDCCRICGTPTVDHRIGPCPAAGVPLFYVQPVRRASTNGTCIRCGTQTPRRKNGDGYVMYCSDRCRKQVGRKL